MTGDLEQRVRRRPIGWKRLAGTLRLAAWLVLVGATALLVRAEAERPVLPRGVVPHTDLVYRRDGGRPVRLDVYVPAGPVPLGGRGRPAVLAIHGGGWRGGSKSLYGPTAAALVAHGYVVVAVDYCLSRPGAPSWPANLDDVRAAVAWLRRNARVYGVDPKRIAALGASAGGHLAALLASSARSPDERVQAVVDFYGPSDLERLAVGSPPTALALALFLGGGPREVPGRYAAASPARLVRRDTPPMLLIHGDDDRLVPLEQSRRLAAALDAAGVPHRLIVVPGARHGFDFLAGIRDLLPDVLAFLESAWNVESVASGENP